MSWVEEQKKLCSHHFMFVWLPTIERMYKNDAKIILVFLICYEFILVNMHVQVGWVY